MSDSMPEGKWRRSWASGKTAAKIGRKQLGFLAKKPFMKTASLQSAKDDLDAETADILFKALSMLKGTALKLAQTLSFEMDMLPEPICKELEKSYNQVPPLNAALVRKIIRTELGDNPEAHFSNFNNRAFAAASLGQVHYALTKTGEALAIKIQYPGIAQTISSDLQIARAFIKPLRESRLILPLLSEVEARLKEEVDYIQEAQNLTWFAKHLNLSRVQIPKLFDNYCSTTVLAMEYIEGADINTWLAGAPGQEERDRVANQLYRLFLHGLYELRCIHADPNPGNFIVKPDGGLGLLDFGCVKHFEKDFVETYRLFPSVISRGSKNDYIELLLKLNFLKTNLSSAAKREIVEAYHPLSQWFARLFLDEEFDFGENEEYFKEGKALFKKVRKLRKYIGAFDTSFVYLDRTRYGLMRLFQKMGARVKMSNTYEMV